jgi:hypothetical protein
MRGLECVGNLDRKRNQRVHVHGAAADPACERRAVQVLHHDEGLAVVVVDFVDRADVRVIERGRGLRFTVEPAERQRIHRDLIGQEFQRDEAAELDVFGLVNHSHAAAAKHGDDAVVRDGLAE